MSGRAFVRAVLVVVVLGAGLGGAARANASEQEGGAIRRFALIIGANDGGKARVRLRYAESDAMSFMRVLERLGGLSNPDRLVLMNPSRAELARGLERMRTLLSHGHERARRTELFLYYSGHSDETGLLIGEERFGYGELRDALESMPADVRIAILDSCASGAMTRRKGGTFTQPFLMDDASKVKGHAILTSAAENEAAQESDRLQSSFFTHYLLSGLRGAADVTNDGKVTLNEVYQFAFNETLARTAQTSAGAQHPGYDIQLSGSGDLVLTDLRRANAGLTLGDDLDGRLFVRDAHGRLAAELRKFRGRPVELGLEPGQYQLTLVDGAETLAARVSVADGRRTPVARNQFGAAPIEVARRRGDAPEMPPAPATTAPPTGPGITADSEGITIKLPKIQWPGMPWPVMQWPPASPQKQPEPVPSHPMPVDPAPSSTDMPGPQEGAPVAETGSSADAATPPEKRYVHEPFVLDTWLQPDPPHAPVQTNLALSFFFSRVSRLDGLQLSLLGGYADDGANGIQVASLGNATGGDLHGVQVGTVASIARGRVSGLQAAGVLTVAGGDALGARVAGVGNVTGGRVGGLQLAGAFNVGGGTAPWPDDAAASTSGLGWAVQGAGAFNVAGGPYRGAQVATAFNWAHGEVEGAQVSVGFNRAGGLRGAQVSLLNVSGDVEGAQVGLVNVAGTVKGTQVGLLNFNDDLEGVPVGLLTFSRKGEYRLQLWASDFAYANAGFRMGTKHFYTLVTASWDPRLHGRFGYAFGFGGILPLGPLFVASDWSIGSDWSSYRFRPGMNVVSRVRVYGGVRIGRFAAFGGVGLLDLFDDADRWAGVSWGDALVETFGPYKHRQQPHLFAGIEF